MNVEPWQWVALAVLWLEVLLPIVHRHICDAGEYARESRERWRRYRDEDRALEARFAREDAELAHDMEFTDFMIQAKADGRMLPKAKA